MDAAPRKRDRGRWAAAVVLALCAGLGLTLVVCWVQAARRAARHVSAHCHVTILTMAVHNFCSANGGYLPNPFVRNPPVSWRVALLPYLDRAAVRRQYRDDLQWYEDVNDEISRMRLPTCVDPVEGRGKTDEAGRALTDWGAVSGPGTVFPHDRAVSLDDVSRGDGLSATLLIGECSGLRIVWTEPRDPDVSREEMGVEILRRPGRTSRRLLSGYWPHGVIVGWCDGSARTLSKDIDPKLLRALCTFDGKEPINEADFRMK